MIWTLLALISMVVLGGFISYYGDLQGRRWGKKRVSWFGLRPKHTAILITSITGAFIALSSIATVLLIAPPVRHIVLRGEQAIRENKDLNAQYERKSRDYENILRENGIRTATAQAKYDALNLDLSQITNELRETQKQKTESQSQLNALQKKNETLQFRFYKTARDLESTDRNLKQRLTQIAAQTQTLQGLQKERADQIFTNNSISKQNLTLTRQKTTLEADNATLANRNATLMQFRAGLEKESAALEHANQVLLTTNRTLLDANAETIRKNETTERQLEDKIQQLTQRQSQLLGLLENADSAADQYAALRQHPIALRSGELLARYALDAHTRPEAVRRQLQELVDNACAVALLRGAGRGENGRTAMLFNRRNVALAGSQVSDERASIDALAEKLAGSNAPILLTAKTLTNTFEGEQAILALDYQTVTPTFKKGEVVAQSHAINGGKPVRQIVEAIVQFLQSDVRDAALKRGTVPQIDLQTGAKQVGSFGPADLVDLTDKVRRMGGIVEITAVAAESLNSAEPLRLNFRVARPQNDL